MVECRKKKLKFLQLFLNKTQHVKYNTYTMKVYRQMKLADKGNPYINLNPYKLINHSKFFLFNLHRNYGYIFLS